MNLRTALMAMLNQNGSMRFRTILRDFIISIFCGHFFSQIPHFTHFLPLAFLIGSVRPVEVTYKDIPVMKPATWEALYAAKLPGMLTPFGHGMQ